MGKIEGKSSMEPAREEETPDPPGFPHHGAVSQSWPRSETTSKTQPDRHPTRQTALRCLGEAGTSPQSLGNVISWGQSKSQRMKADDWMSGAGWEALPGGGGWRGGKGGGVEAWLVLHRHISSFFQTGKSCLGCAHLQRVTVFTTLPGSTDFFLSFSWTQLVFFRARAEQTVEALLPPCYVQKHSTSDSKSQARMGSRSGRG